LNEINRAIIAKQLQSQWSRKEYQHITVQHREEVSSPPPDRAPKPVFHHPAPPAPEPIVEIKSEPAPKPKEPEPEPVQAQQDKSSIVHPSSGPSTDSERNINYYSDSSEHPSLASFLASSSQVPPVEESEGVKFQPSRRRFRPDPLVVAAVAAVMLVYAGAGVWKWQHAKPSQPQTTNTPQPSEAKPEPKRLETETTKNQPAVALPSLASLNPKPQRPAQEVTETKPLTDSTAPSTQAVAEEIHREVQNINGMVHNVQVNHVPDGVSEIDMLRAIAVRLSALEKRIDTALPPLPDLPDTPPLKVNSKRFQVNTAPPARWRLQKTSGDVRIYTLETNDLLAISSRIARFGGPRPIQIGVGQPFPDGGKVTSIDVDRLTVVVRQDGSKE
jgi:hypothetical protein